MPAALARPRSNGRSAYGKSLRLSISEKLIIAAFISVIEMK